MKKIPLTQTQIDQITERCIKDHKLNPVIEFYTHVIGLETWDNIGSLNQFPLCSEKTSRAIYEAMFKISNSEKGQVDHEVNWGLHWMNKGFSFQDKSIPDNEVWLDEEKISYLNPPIRKQLYKVYKVYRGSGRKIILERNLTEDQAQRLVQSFPSNNKTMVVYTKQSRP